LKTTATQYTVQQYCDLMSRGVIKVNSDYQRSSGIWPTPAKSFLIETILMGFPIPKLCLHPQTELSSLTSRMDIVDGQQRSRTIREFLEGDFRLSRKSSIEDARGKNFDELNDDMKLAFIEYPLSIDLFSDASRDEIREAFRRINSHTTPLNPEEQRHARWQGAFKWFVVDQCRRLDPTLVRLGVLTESLIARMQDAKLIADLVFALEKGLKTTKAPQLNQFYKENDQAFESDGAIAKRLRGSMDALGKLESLAKSAVMKTHVFYSLALATMHAIDPVPVFEEIYSFDSPPDLDPRTMAERLSTLVLALEQGEDGNYVDFWQASDKGTNVEAARRTRFLWICGALDGNLQGE
jgi:hypothetical protein